MSEQQDLSPDDGIRIFEMRFTVPGESVVYELKMAASQNQLDLAFVDLPDEMILRMANEMREFRKKRVWGECAADGCDKARTKIRDRCPPHAWEQDREGDVNAGPQYPSAL